MIKEKRDAKTLRYLALTSKALDKCPEFFTDTELVELLLCTVLNKKAAKSIAPTFLSKFKDLNSLINIRDEDLNLKGTSNKKIYNMLLVIKELIKRILASKLDNQNILDSFDELINYLKFTMMSLKVEQLRILYLNKKNILINDEVLSTGTVDELPVFPRLVIKRALFHEASSIIIVHNHPSGNTKPSQKDIKITNRIVNACSSINIKVLDHIIISKGEYFSFKDTITELVKISVD